jgi:hypothetical protein
VTRRALAGAVAVLVCACALAKAPPVKPNPMAADEAMFGFLRAKDDAHAAHLIAEERKFLEIGALRSPDEVVVANVLLKRGFTGVSVRALLEPRELLLAGMEAKIPFASSSKILSVGIGQERILLMSATTLDERVDRAIGRERYKFMQRANRFGPGEHGAELEAHIAELREQATSPEFAAYRLEVIGTRAQLFSLLRDVSVRAVFVSRDSGRARSLLAERRELEKQARYIGPPVRMGRVEGVKPIPAGPRIPRDQSEATAQ